MQEKILDYDRDYDKIKKELLPFLTEEEKDSFMDAFLKLAVY